MAIVLTILLFRCNVEDKTKFKLLKSVNETLQGAEKNRIGLEKVLHYYGNTLLDSLKFNAACFLISNMDGHYSLAGENLIKHESSMIR